MSDGEDSAKTEILLFKFNFLSSVDPKLSQRIVFYMDADVLFQTTICCVG